MSPTLSTIDREATARRLLALRRHLLEEAQRKGVQASELGSAAGQPGDPGDHSLADEQAALLAQLDSRDRERVMALDDALQRLDEGTYGACRRCGERIAEERLEALPLTQLCVECQELQERESTAPGESQRRKM
ncbi:MAG: TraR/DksA C4-type zinc finger protein [Proteobacteria bacterium]|nr:TraR/DksA C4-type zinc finger protein [Pseudomonadota bacterium]